jgi:ubiquinone/menaquinone biosynthesis C-methylase UbiE
MLDTADAAETFPTAHVELAPCDECGFVANIAFEPRWSAYSPAYEDQQGFSPTFSGFATQLAQDWIARFDLIGKSAVEIGCSKGDFLTLLAEHGDMRTVGIDPAADADRIAAPRHGSIRLIAEHFGEEHLRLPADLICCRHTLEHLQPIHDVLSLMRRLAEASPGAVVCIEVPDATRLWCDAAVEDIYYEHCSYFTPGALARALRFAGFAVVGLRRAYSDQYLIAEAVLDSAADRQFVIEESPHTARAWLEGFRRKAPDQIERWRRLMARAHGEGRRVAVWGSGSKSVAFLKAVEGIGEVDTIVDINPHRAGRYMPGIRTPISAPPALRRRPPDIVIAMNAVYQEEIAQDLGRMSLYPEILALGQL